MKKIDLGQTMNTIASVGVVGGLILVALELNQATNAILGATYQANAESSAEWNKWTIDSDYLLPIVVKYLESGRDSLSLEEQI